MMDYLKYQIKKLSQKIFFMDEKNEVSHLKTDPIFDVFKNNPLFCNLDDDELKKIYNQCSQVSLNKNDYLFYENDPSNEMYIIISGSINITKQEKLQQREHTLTILHKGETIGEMALISHEPRSTSVYANTDTRLLRIPFEVISSLNKNQSTKFNIFSEVAQKISSRLRDTNEVIVKALEEQLMLYKTRVAMANFIIGVILLLTFYIYAQVKIATLAASGVVTTHLAVGFLTIVFLFIILLIKLSDLSFSACGITLYNWKKSIYESLLFTIPILFAIVVIKWILLKANITFLNLGNSLFDPYVGFQQTGINQNIFKPWLFSLLLYSLISVPLQELIARGTLQTALEIFLVNKHRKWFAILLSNTIFSSFHAAVSLIFALVVFIPGIFWGWLYSRHHNLLGVWLSHALFGVWIFWIVGFWVPSS